jgi:hypothetical protein
MVLAETATVLDISAIPICGLTIFEEEDSLKRQKYRKCIYLKAQIELTHSWQI